jgi:hypothetical protein
MEQRVRRQDPFKIVGEVSDTSHATNAGDAGLFDD